MIIGIIYGLYLKTSMAIFFIFFLIPSIIKYKKFYKNRKIIITLLASAIIFSSYINILNNKYEKFYKNIRNEIEIEAIIISEAKDADYYKVYNIKSKDKRFILYTNNVNLKYGMRIKIRGNFLEPEERRNYKGFDYKQYLKTRKIYGSIKSNNIEIIGKEQTNIIARTSNNVRNKIIETANKILPNYTQGLLVGILIGEKTKIPENIIENFSISSLSHILATSGTHISYIILGITYLLLKSKIPKRTSYFLINLILIFFMFIVGFTASVVRASIMGILLISSKIVYRKPDVLTSMAISLIITLSYNPFSIQDIGLELSYLGTLGIVILNRPIKNYIINKLPKIPKQIIEIVSVTVSAQILIIPILILKFNTVSLTFILSNIIAIPITGIIILYGYINILVGIFAIKVANKMSIILNILLKIIISISNIISKLPFSKILIPTPNIIYILLYYLIILNFQKEKYLKILLITLILILSINVVYNIFPQQLEIHIVDVGQGDCQLIITPNGKAMIIDGGEKENVLLEYLLDKQIMKIDYMMISHFDSDHCYNLIEVLENLKINNLIVSRQIEETELFNRIIKICQQNGTNVIIVEAGKEINIDKEIKLKILWPTRDINEINSINNNSIVARMEYNQFSMLFTGDIEETVENRLIEIYSKELLNTTVLKVAHHGSETSSNEGIIKLIAPKISVIGVGKDNKFGHPNKEVIRRIEEQNSQLFRTDLNGEITIKVNKKGRIKINCMNM